MDGSNGELQDLSNRLVDRAMAYGIEVSTEKSKIMTNNTNTISIDMNMNGQKLPAQQKSASGLPQQWQQWPD